MGARAERPDRLTKTSVRAVRPLHAPWSSTGAPVRLMLTQPSVRSGAIFTDILQFRARVLVNSGGTRVYGLRRPNTALPSSTVTTHAARLRHSLPRRVGPLGQSGRRSVIMRPRRRMGISRTPPIGWPQCGPGVRRPRLPSGLLEPLHRCRKYISSGVCPRNAECGSTVLCSWT